MVRFRDKSPNRLIRDEVGEVWGVGRVNMVCGLGVDLGGGKTPTLGLGRLFPLALAGGDCSDLMGPSSVNSTAVLGAIYWD